MINEFEKFLLLDNFNFEKAVKKFNKEFNF